MTTLNTEYEVMFCRLETVETERAGHRLDDGYREIVDAIQHIPGLEIELVGTWLWVSGNTRPARDALKAAGLRWSHHRARWYWHPGEARHRASRYEFDAIRARYGSERIQGEPREAIA